MTNAIKDPSPASLIQDASFLEDMARFGEGSMSERRIKKKWGFADAVWTQLGDDEALVEAIELERERRLRSGLAARELAQQAFVAAPGVLGGILNDNDANPRYRIESAKELRQIATPPAETAATSASRFIISIDLSGDLGRRNGEDVHYFNKPREVSADDPDHIDVAALAAIAASKPNGGPDGQPL